MLTIYHNPRCKKSRAGLEYLKSKTGDLKIREYLKEPMTKEEFREIVLKSNLKPIELVRTQEEQYKRELKGKNFTDEEWINIILENQKLVQRPIVVGAQKAVLAQPPENIDVLL